METTTKPEYFPRSAESLFDVASDVIRILREAGETLAVAESLTAGGVMAALTSVPGASSVFRGGIVAYATPLKRTLLNVNDELIAAEGVIHADVAAQMASGVIGVTGCDDVATTWGIGTTGVAGPASQDGKPVGMVYIGIAHVSGRKGFGPFHFPGDRERVREATVLEALSRLRIVLLERGKAGEERSGIHGWIEG
ncbi:hypothetical protein OQA88_10766 [Cercophora sp. LCS_1]